MKTYLLIYSINSYVVESYQFGNRNDAVAKRWQLTTNGRYNQGTFKIIER